MSRPLRIEYPGACYHVMNRGAAYQPIFRSDEDWEVFLVGLGEVYRRWGVKIFCYCLMDNHYHLGVQTPEVSLSRIMRHVDGVYTQRFNRRHRRDGPLFRGRYRAILVEGDRYLLSLARYIHHNPVAAGFAKLPEQYRWSSLGFYLNQRGRPEWLETETLLGYFDGRKKAFLEFMHSQVETELRQFYGSNPKAPILGSESFIDWIKRKGWRSQTDREIPQRRHLRLGMETYIQAVSQTLGVQERVLLQPRRGRKNESRGMGMYLCREVGGFSHKEIARKFSAGSYSTVSSMCALMRKRLKADARLARRIETIRAQLQDHYGQQAT